MRRMRPAILLLAVMALFLFGRWYLNDPEEGITRAQAARMIAYMMYDDETLKAMETGRFLDVEEGMWYAEEISAVVADGLMETDGDLFHPTEYLTYGETRQIAGRFGIETDIPLFKKDRSIPKEEWLQLYEQMIADVNTVQTAVLDIEAVPAISDTLKAWEVQTSQGLYICEGVSMDEYVGRRVTVYIRDSQILMAAGQASDSGAEIIDVRLQTAMEETEGAADKETVKETAMDEHAFVQEEIRVCLMTTDFLSEYHEKVTLMADTAWTIAFGSSVRQCQPGETVTLTAADFEEDGETADVTTDGKGMLQVLSIERSSGFPSYEGKITVMRSGDRLVLINQLPLENYLYGVVPGEMPASYGEEALKAQAVCARSYGVLAMESPRYDFADVNDSTACQVYMNQGTDERCTAAVDATKGEVLAVEQQVVTAKYFSTSCGSLSDSRDIWLYPDEETETSHLLAGLTTIPLSVPELSEEAVFRAFIDTPEEDYIESGEPWFRWQTFITIEDIQNAMGKYLKQRMSVNPKHFTVLSENGEIDLSDVKNVAIEERADSGVVKKIRIIGDEQELTVSGEYNIRCLLSPGTDERILRQDGTEVSGLSLLPSGYFYLVEEQKEGTVSGYAVYGGGLGHGAGMSQNGARILAEKGWDYKKILTYYFQNIEIIDYLEKISSMVSPEMDSGCSRLLSSAPRKTSYMHT